MNKCEFCTASKNQNGRFVCAGWTLYDCQRAIETMVKVMEIQATSRNTKNYNINKRTENRNKRIRLFFQITIAASVPVRCF